ncbi:MAG: arginyl-tRNA-protein transferase [Alphaproteobacteria bacterium BRH_c36]|nr:MAG: arginyl-tRNA-protein transferase [Alphaproteobacteria bacterium BRH_c36]
MTAQHNKNFPEFYITAPQPCPYLPGRHERKLFTHLTVDRSQALIDNLLKGGFRRSQSIAYTPHCEGCSACVSVRVPVDEFSPGRSMRRITNRNRDLVARPVPAIATSEHYALFRHYIDSRHGDGGMADMTVLDFSVMIEESPIQTFLIEYRMRPPSHLERDHPLGQLKAVALCDMLSDGISMVYSFFDAAEDWRSLGTYMILESIERTRRQGLPYLYLGYWVDGSRKMAYKARFQPQEHLTADGWRAAGDI